MRYRCKRITAIIVVTFAITNALPLPRRLQTRYRYKRSTVTKALTSPLLLSSPLRALDRCSYCCQRVVVTIAVTFAVTNALPLQARYRYKFITATNACCCFFFLNVGSFSEDAELDDAVHTALLTMREGFEGEMTEKNIEASAYGIALITSNSELVICALQGRPN